MTLEPPSIPPGPPGTVEMTDALDFVRHRTGTICYLDPPYSSHQYGSNYFMLNTIALWDRPPVDDERDVDGHLLRKAGIRPDWVRTRSEFCSKRRAQAALEELVDAVDSRYLVMSYSTDGIIELEAIADILSRHGMLTVRASDHVTYRGGRQCNTRKTANAELLFVVDRHKPTGRRNVERSLLEARLAHSLRRSYRPERIREKFAVDGSRIILLPGWALASEHLTGFLSPTPSPGTASLTELRSVADALDWCACPDRETELEVLLKLLVRLESGEVRRVARRALTVLRKLAHPRYVTQFRDGLAAFRGVVAARAGELRQAAQQLDSLERQVELRLEKGQATP
jgi:adenine-specific DNA-methyltransferase